MARVRSALSYANGLSTGRLRVALLGALSAACAACVVFPTPALAGTLDQQQTDGSGGAIGITSTSSTAQTFTAGITGKLDQVDLEVYESGSDSLVVEIRDSAGGVPGNKVLASGNIPASAVPSQAAFVPVTFNPPAAVAAGSQYAIVVYTSGAPASHRWSLSAGDSYTGGVAFTASSSPPSESTSWTSNPYDFAFKTYVVPTSGIGPGIGPAGSGGGPGSGSGGGPSVAASRESLSPSAFPAAPSGPSVLAAKRTYGTMVTYALNQAASVRFTVQQRRTGRKVTHGRRTTCDPPTRRNAKRRKCTRLVALRGSFTRPGAAGTNRFRFTGRLNSRRLAPGHYVLVATPNANGRTGRAASASFTIIR